MKDINEAYRFCESIANKDRQGEFTPDAFNLWADSAQKDTIAKRAPVYGRSEAIDPSIINFLVKVPLKTDASGKLTYPTYYLRATSLVLVDPVTDAAKALVDQLTDAELARRETSKLRPATEEFPLSCFYSDHIQILPRKELDVRFTYLRLPKKPHFDYTISEYIPVYNAPPAIGDSGEASQNFEVPEILHNEVCFRILQYAGINLSDQQLVQYGLTREQLAV